MAGREHAVLEGPEAIQAFVEVGVVIAVELAVSVPSLVDSVVENV